MKVKRTQVIKTKALYGKIAEDVRAARTKHGLSQRQLAQLIGASRQTITAIEAAENSMLVQDLLLIYTVLGLKTDTLKSQLGITNVADWVVTRLKRRAA